jgi:hypothetical protein
LRALCFFQVHFQLFPSISCFVTRFTWDQCPKIKKKK